MRQIPTVSRLAALLSVLVLSGVAAQTPGSGLTDGRSATASSPVAAAGRAVGSGAPVTRLTTPTPGVPAPGGTLPGNAPSASPLLQRPAVRGTGDAPASANQPAGNSPASLDSVLPGAPGADLNAPVDASPGALSETPDASLSGVEGVNAPGVGTTPLLSQPAEPARPVLPTPVPVLPLSLIYGAILLFAAGYFWYTARRAQQAEAGRSA
jgi:hypothetical protein